MSLNHIESLENPYQGKNRLSSMMTSLSDKVSMLTDKVKSVTEDVTERAQVGYHNLVQKGYSNKVIQKTLGIRKDWTMHWTGLKVWVVWATSVILMACWGGWWGSNKSVDTSTNSVNTPTESAESYARKDIELPASIQNCTLTLDWAVVTPEVMSTFLETDAEWNQTTSYTYGFQDAKVDANGNTLESIMCTTWNWVDFEFFSWADGYEMYNYEPAPQYWPTPSSVSYWDTANSEELLTNDLTPREQVADDFKHFVWLPNWTYDVLKAWVPFNIVSTNLNYVDENWEPTGMPLNLSFNYQSSLEDAWYEFKWYIIYDKNGGIDNFSNVNDISELTTSDIPEGWSVAIAASKVNEDNYDIYAVSLLAPTWTMHDLKDENLN